MVEIELPRHRHREVAVRHFDQLQIAKCAAIAQERELVLAAPRALPCSFDLAGQTEPQAPLAEQIEPDIGHRDALFQDGSVTDPLAQSLREDYIGVAEPK